MAIFGKIETLERQAATPELAKVYDFLKNTDLKAVFDKVSIGRNQEVEIDGRNIYAIFQTYVPKAVEQARFEGHRKYIDLQYIYEGAEAMGVCDLQNVANPTEYDEAKDIYFTDNKMASLLCISEGEAAIFSPDDLHAPGLSVAGAEPAPIQKIVFKIKA